VDAWYPGARAVVLVTDEENAPRSVALARPADAYGVGVYELRRGWVARDAEGALRRLPDERRRVMAMLADPEERLEHRVWWDAGWTVMGVNVAEGDFEDEDEDFDDWGDDEDIEVAAGTRQFHLDTEAALGWRGRAVALALLEAVRLSRRAFAVRRAGGGTSPEALEALLVLLAADAPAHDEIARVLARDDHDVLDALAELKAAGHAESREDDPEAADVWTLTAEGREAAVAWIAGVLPLFEGWPPDVRDVDDADAPP
jgi:hypothetical protein